MRLDKLFIGVGVFMLFIATGLGIMFGINGPNGIFDDYEVNASNDKFAELTYNITKTYEVYKGIDDNIDAPDVTDDTEWETLSIGTYNALRTAKNSLSIVSSLVYVIGGDYLPPFMMDMGMIIIGIAVIFTVIYMVFRFMPRD